MKDNIKKLFSNIPNLKTDRLILRQIIPSDCKDIYEYSRIKDVTKYLLWNRHESIEYTKYYINSVRRLYKKGEFYDWAVVIKESGKMIGTCGFTEINQTHLRAEVGYVINPSYQGMGYATEAVMAVISFAFNHLGMHRVEAHYMKGNEKSLAVMKRCGMSEEGMLKDFMLVKGMFRDIGICSVTKDEFAPSINVTVEKKSRFPFA